MAEVKTDFGEVDLNLESMVAIDVDNITPNEELMDKEDAKEFFKNTNTESDKIITDMLEKGREGVKKELDENGKEKEVELTDRQQKQLDQEVDKFANNLVNTPLEEQENNNVNPYNLKSLFDKKILLGFEDKGDDDNYTPEEFEELIQANIEKRSKDAQTNALKELYEKMPQSVQQVMVYATNGASPEDMKNLYKTLSVSEEQSKIDINDVNGQKQIIRKYLTATNWGDENEIEEEIASLSDKNELEKKAKQFKPKLDKLTQEEINKKLEKQKEISKQREQRNMEYVQTVGKALSGGTLNGIPLDKNTAQNLFQGMVQAQFPLSNGNKGNYMSYLIDKYQWVEPNPELLAEALWLMADPEEYRNRVYRLIENEVNQKTYRKLQTEQESSRKPSTEQEKPQDKIQRRMSGTKEEHNFFGR